MGVVVASIRPSAIFLSERPLLRGDKILSVDNYDCHRSSVADVERLLASRGGKVQLVVEHNEMLLQIFEASLQSSRGLAPSSRPSSVGPSLGRSNEMQGVVSSSQRDIPFTTSASVPSSPVSSPQVPQRSLGASTTNLSTKHRPSDVPPTSILVHSTHTPGQFEPFSESSPLANRQQIQEQQKRKHMQQVENQQPLSSNTDTIGQQEFQQYPVTLAPADLENAATIVITRVDSYLGLRLTSTPDGFPFKGVFVSSVSPDCMAQGPRKLIVGDLVLAVDGTSCSGASLDDVTLLLTNKDRVVLDVRNVPELAELQRVHKIQQAKALTADNTSTTTTTSAMFSVVSPNASAIATNNINSPAKSSPIASGEFNIILSITISIHAPICRTLIL